MVKKKKRRPAEKMAKIQEAISLVLQGYTKADAYRKAFNCHKKTAAAMAVNLFREEDVQDMLECAKQRAAQQIAERTTWTREQAVEKLKGLISASEESLRRKMNMPAVIGITNAVKELNAMNNFTGKDINVSTSTVIFQGEDNLED